MDVSISKILMENLNNYLNAIFYSPYKGYVRLLNVVDVPNYTQFIECVNSHNERCVFDDYGFCLNNETLKIVGEIPLCFVQNNGKLSNDWENIDNYDLFYVDENTNEEDVIYEYDCYNNHDISKLN